MRFFVASAIVIAGITAPAVSYADVEEGKRLFEEAKAAMAIRKYDEACPKFEASFAASQVAGSLLNWADCEEQRGRLATALELWKRGEKVVAADAERVQFVRSRIGALVDRVPRVSFEVSPAVSELAVTVDGKPVVTTEVLLLDPGQHVVEAKGRGLSPERHMVELLPGESKMVKLFPAVRAEGVKPPEPVVPAAPSDDGAPLVIAGWVVGSVGLAGLAAFGVTAGLVLDACHGTLDPCGGTEGRDAEQVRSLNIANATMLGLGIAGLGAGAVLLGVGYSKDGEAETGAMTMRFGVGSASVKWVFQ